MPYFKTQLIVDRRVYDKKGTWKSPNNDIEENIFYFIKEHLTMVSSFENGREQLPTTMTITVFGFKPIAVKDIIKLDNGDEFKVVEITPNFIEHNPLVVDKLKPRVGSIDLVLE